MARAGEDALVRRESSGADAETHQTAGVSGREPDDAGSAVGPVWRIVGVDQTCVRHSVFRISCGQSVGVAYDRRREVPLVVALAEKAFEKRPDRSHGLRDVPPDQVNELTQALLGGRHCRWRWYTARRLVGSTPPIGDTRPHPFRPIVTPLRTGPPFSTGGPR